MRQLQSLLEVQKRIVAVPLVLSGRRCCGGISVLIPNMFVRPYTYLPYLGAEDVQGLGGWGSLD